MSSNYDTEVLDRPLRSRKEGTQTEDLAPLHHEIRELAKLCLNPLPKYQILVEDVQDAFEDKLLVIARDGDNCNKLIGFVSAVFLPIECLNGPLLHTGLTVVHPDYRKTGLVHQLFFNLFLQLLSDFPNGLWLSTLSAVITSLVHIAKYTTKVFPSPEWSLDNANAGPSETHLLIARDIMRRHRHQMLIAPHVEFDENTFVCIGCNDTEEGKVFLKDSSNTQYWHRDSESSEFYRRLMRGGMGDDVLQISYLKPEHVLRMVSAPRFKEQWQDKFSKL